MREQDPNNRPVILLLEDDFDTREEISETLSSEGFQVIMAEDIDSFEKATAKKIIDLFLMDLSLPDGSGLNLAKKIRRNSNVGIIIVSGKSNEVDRVVGLEIGADDYISKPFSPRELLARVKAVLRRTEGNFYAQATLATVDDSIVKFLDYSLSLSSRQLFLPDGSEVALTTAEFDLLNAFTQAPNRVLSRDFLLDRIHGNDWSGYDRGIDGLISRVRKKFSVINPEVPIIKTIRGVGYMFMPETHKARVTK